MSEDWQELRSKANFRLFDIVDSYLKNKSKSLTYKFQFQFTGNKKEMPHKKRCRRWKGDIENVENIALQDISDSSLER